jgi:DNA invertase Pin-like site-specific DNA recombinase
MSKRIFIYTRLFPSDKRTQQELRELAESGGDTVVGAQFDDPTNLGKGKYSGWRGVVASLGEVDQIVVSCSSDLPGRTVQDLLKILDLLRDHGVSLFVHHEGIDIDNGAAAILDLIASYRAAKHSEAIRVGQMKARTAGKWIGRPQVPDHIRGGIVDALSRNYGIRPTARRFRVSPATVINIRASMGAGPSQMAA